MGSQAGVEDKYSWRWLAPWLGAAAGYTALIVFFTWPLATHLSSVLPHDTGDPLFGAYLFWWNAHVLPLTERWWNAPFFWPTPGALGLSEHLLGFSPVTLPLQWLGAGPIATYNITFLLSFVLSAMTMHVFVFGLTRRHGAAWVGAVLFAFSPYRTAQIAHIQVLWTFWMPLALLALHRYAGDGRRRWLALFGAMWLGQAASNGYYLLFFPVLVGCWVLWFLISQRDLRKTAALLATSAVASIPLLPILLGYERIHHRLLLERSISEIRDFSADVTAFVTAAPSSLLWSRLSAGARPEQELFPGIMPVLLVAAAVILALVRAPNVESSHRKLQRVLAALGSTALLIAVSPWLFGPWKLSIGSATLLSV